MRTIKIYSGMTEEYEILRTDAAICVSVRIWSDDTNSILGASICSMSQTSFANCLHNGFFFMCFTSVNMIPCREDPRNLFTGTHKRVIMESIIAVLKHFNR